MGASGGRVKPISRTIRPKIIYPEDVVLRLGRSTGA
jgi:hypothetical protein